MNRLFGNRSEPEDERPLVATADEEMRPQIVQIFALVGEAMAGATHALLSGDRELAKSVVDKDIAIDTLVNSLVNAAELQLVENESLNVADRRRLLTLLRILSLLHGGELCVCHIQEILAALHAHGYRAERVG